MRIPFVSLLLQGIPETVAIVFSAFIIAKLPLEWSKIILIGVSLAFATYLIRLFPIPFGVHTICTVFLLFVILNILTKRDISLSFMASLISYIILALCETVCLTLLMPLFSVTPKVFLTDPMVRIGLGEFQVVLLFISAFFLNKLYVNRIN